MGEGKDEFWFYRTAAVIRRFGHMVSGRWYNGGMVQGRRPVHVMEQKREEVLESLALGHTRRASAHLAGVDENTIRNWEAADSEFSARLREAEAKAAARFERTVIDAGASDPKIALAYLERRARADWGKQVQVEQSGALEITVVRKGRDTE